MKTKLIGCLFFLLAVGVISFWICFGGWKELHLPSPNAKFDSMSALASALAFVGMLCTIFLQQEELKATREELAKSAKANKESSELSKAQLRAGYLSTVMQLDMTKLMNYLRIHENKVDSDNVSSEINKMLSALNAALAEYDALTKAYKAEEAPPMHY